VNKLNNVNGIHFHARTSQGWLNGLWPFPLVVRAMGVRRGGKMGTCPPGNWNREPKISRKRKISSL